MIAYIILLVIHILGSIAHLIRNCKNGNMEYAAKYGDGIRFEQPCDIVFESFAFWEFMIFAECMDDIGNVINNCFKKYYKYK